LINVGYNPDFRLWEISLEETLVVGNISDEPFAIDVASVSGQVEDISDIIALKDFANTEFCPRFIRDENDLTNIGYGMSGKRVVIVSATYADRTRNQLAMRNLIIARSAVDNGAKEVILVEPDLFYSAQDRGPRPNHGEVDYERSLRDYKKFDGQPFTSQLYAELLKLAGVKRVITVHNHSSSVGRIFTRMFDGHYYNLVPDDLYARYIKTSGIVNVDNNGKNLVLCSPDFGAIGFTNRMLKSLQLQDASIVVMDKSREGERKVNIQISTKSPVQLADIEGKDIIIFDDMVRTGSTILEASRVLRRGRPRKIIFVVTHFYASAEMRENMNSRTIDEIVTTNTMPTILNRDMQGRLRKKMVVLKIEKWIAKFLREYVLHNNTESFGDETYTVDMSSKHPRYIPRGPIS